MADLTTWVFIALNLVLYGLSGYIYIQFLLYLWKNQANKLLSGKLQFGEILSMAAGIVVLGAMLVFGPYYLAKGIQLGWNNFMSVMVEVSNEIVQDVTGMIDGGNMPVYIPEKPETKTTVTDGTQTITIPGVDSTNGSDINPATGKPFDDPHSGGGGGVPPTPIIPDMVTQPVQVVPTPTLAPTATPFNADTWKPGQPAPTPVGN